MWYRLRSAATRLVASVAALVPRTFNGVRVETLTADRRVWELEGVIRISPLRQNKLQAALNECANGRALAAGDCLRRIEKGTGDSRAVLIWVPW